MDTYSKQDIFQKVDDFLEEHSDGVLEVFGPTASGKTDFAVQLAKKYNGEVICVDSRQVFRDFDISSAKIMPEESQGVVHWGLDLVTPEEDFSVADFQTYAFEKIQDILSRGKRPIMCGGTMLWLDAVSEHYLFSHDKHKKSTQKGTPKWPFLKMGIHWERAVLYDRCNRRSVWMFDNGLVEEVEMVCKKYPTMTRSASTNFGYQEIRDYLSGLSSYQETLARNQKRNRNYAKRQLTWWRGRDDVHWVSGASMKQ